MSNGQDAQSPSSIRQQGEEEFLPLFSPRALEKGESSLHSLECVIHDNHTSADQRFTFYPLTGFSTNAGDSSSTLDAHTKTGGISGDISEVSRYNGRGFPNCSRHREYDIPFATEELSTKDSPNDLTAPEIIRRGSYGNHSNQSCRGYGYSSWQAGHDMRSSLKSVSEFPDGNHLTSGLDYMTEGRSSPVDYFHDAAYGTELCSPNQQLGEYSGAELTDGCFDQHSIVNSPKCLVNAVTPVEVYSPTIADGLIIADLAAFKAEKMRHRLILERKESDFPLDASSQRGYIKRLFDAIKNIQGIRDSEKVALSWSRGKYPDKDIEITCWEVLLTAREVQEGGVILRAPHESSFEEFETFSHRMDAIIEACNISKAFCKSLLQPSFIHRVADQPTLELRRKIGNQRLNAKKTKQNKAGQKAIKHGYADEETGHWLAGIHEDQSDHELENFVEPCRAAKSGSRKRMRIHDNNDDLELPGSPAKSPARLRYTRKRNAARHAGVNDEVKKEPNDYGTSQPQSVPTRDGKECGIVEQSSIVQPHILIDPDLIPTYSKNFQQPGNVDLEEMYKATLGMILQISPEVVSTYTLYDLRLYARACNGAFSNTPWFHTHLPPQYFGISAIIHDNQGHIAGHITDYFPWLQRLAKARHDVLDNGQLNLEKALFFFPNNGERAQDEALGVITNPFGLIQC